jgi:hypothetical protein
MSETYISKKDYSGEDLERYGDFLVASLTDAKDYTAVSEERVDGVVKMAVLKRNDSELILNLQDGVYSLKIRSDSSDIGSLLGPWLSNSGFRTGYAAKVTGWFDDPEASSEREFDGYEWRSIECLDHKTANRMNFDGVVGQRVERKYDMAKVIDRGIARVVSGAVSILDKYRR